MNHQGLLASTSIPLHCNICPRRPDFSDVSHLLTHIASKGHLSNYYKAKVKSGTDAASQRVVDEYDDWYETWNVQDLMGERMSQKENKKKSGVNGSAGSSRRAPGANLGASTTSRNTSAVGARSLRRVNVLRESTLDPQLDRRVKTEPKSRSTTPFAMDPAAIHRSYVPPMQSWPATPYTDSPMTGQTSVLDSIYTPSSGSVEFDLPRQVNGRTARRNLSGSNHSYLAEEELEFDDGLNENTKLKGVYWDGMGMFDSATPDMRRKRNQKKSTSVIQHLQATSEVVEATECVFDVGGVLRRERPITGNPEEDDGLGRLPGEETPEPEFQPTKKKAGRRSRPALVEKDVNSDRTLRRRGESHHPPFGNTNRRGPYFDGGDEEDDEWTYGKPIPKKRTGLSIHRDNSGPDITFDNPPPMNTLNSEFRNPFHTATHQQRGPQLHQNGTSNRVHQRQPSLPFGAGFRGTNINPLNNFQPPNFGSFGNFSGQSMFQNASLGNNPFPLTNGQHAYAAFQQQFAMPPPTFTNGSDVFQGTGNCGTQSHDQWDVFAFGSQDLGMPTNTSTGFHMNADFNSVNPLFFSSNQPGAEDDEETISAPASEH